MHFHPTARKLYLNKLTLTVCLRNARTTYSYFQKRLLTTFPGRAEKRKRKKNPEASRRKKLSIRPMTSKYVILTSVRRRHVALTSVRRYFDVLHLLECYLKKVKSPTAHDVLLTSMRRDLRRIDVDTTSFCHSNCLPCLSK